MTPASDHAADLAETSRFSFSFSCLSEHGTIWNPGIFSSATSLSKSETKIHQLVVNPLINHSRLISAFRAFLFRPETQLGYIT